MPRDPKTVWQYFAQALVREEDPEQISYLTQKLFESLADTEEQKKPKLPGVRHVASR